MNPELLRFHEQIVGCQTPEDLFGALTGSLDDKLNAVKTLYKKFALMAHEDRYTRDDEKRVAHLAFTRLNTLHQLAADRIKDDKYGTNAAIPRVNLTPVSMKSSKGIYIVQKGFAFGDLSTLYAAEFDGKMPVLLKIAKHHTVNDLLKVEATALRGLNELAAATASYRQFIPTLLDSFQIKVAPDNSVRQVNVLNMADGFISLERVMAEFPEGVDPRHFVWVFKRLLTILSFTHQHKMIHGSVLPQHVLIHPTTHAIRLVDWCFTTVRDTKLVATVKGYESYYPPEVKAKAPLTPAYDIYMAATCMAYILGSDFEAWPKGSKVPPKFRRFLDACLLPNAARRPQNAWDLFVEMDELGKDVYGPSKYVPMEVRA